jgi:hypothetical protein
MKQKHNVKIMFFDPLDTTHILNNYSYIDYTVDTHPEKKVFDYVVGFIQKIGITSDTKHMAILRLKQLLEKSEKLIKLKNMYIDGNFLKIDIFLGVNVQGITYNYHGRINKLVHIMNLYINLLTKSKLEQSFIPMIFLYCDHRLNVTNFDELKKSMMEINEYYLDSKKNLEYFSFSSLNYLENIGDFPFLLEYPQ